ncbi:MAG: HAD-IIIA family hydrolase [Treponema sp.]|jgi:D-glycero-D-manno-heptose 1,7-bisphosphate phosphatase|nr:HAD-IIIA family hydrolase [Treponema sp.]
MAGGKGKRIAQIADNIPKPMIPFFNKPILEYQLDCLKRYGLTDIIMVTGHLGAVIKDHFLDGHKFGCVIDYFHEEEPLGTAGALSLLLPSLSEDFILVNGDIIFDFNFERFIKFHRDRNADATIAVHPNSHPFDSAIIVPDYSGRIVTWLNKEDPRRYYKNLVNSGIHLLNKNLLKLYRQNTPYNPGKVDLDRDILKPLVASGRIYAYKTPEYIKDMGTPERYNQVKTDIESGLVKAKNLSLPQRAVFLDRDGTLNVMNGFIKKSEDLELLPGTAEAVKGINNSGYLAIVITNQPVIARGEVSLGDLEEIHNKLETDLGLSGAYLDDIFFCPHHPDKGFPGERPEYKIDCSCRKPKPGLIFQAAEKYNIDLSQSYMVGDNLRDVQAAIAAGCRPVLLSHTCRNQIKGIDGYNMDIYQNLMEFFVNKFNKP